MKNVATGITTNTKQLYSADGKISVVMVTYESSVIPIASCLASEAQLKHLCCDSDTWVNLTNGIDAVGYLDEFSCPYNFCRFQSTSFEQRDWGAAIDSMPDDMLVNLALGRPQTIIDFGANKNCPRAMRQGIPIAADILSYVWDMEMSDRLRIFSRDGKNIITVDDGTRSDMLRNLTKHQKNRLNYFKRYVCTDKIQFLLLCGKTMHDNDYDYHVDMLYNCSKCLK